MENPISNQEKNKRQQIIKQFEVYQNKFESSLSNTYTMCYLLSNVFYQQFISYLTISSINKDLVDMKPTGRILAYYPLPQNPLNKVLKQNSKYQVDYIIINKQAWDYLKSSFQVEAIQITCYCNKTTEINIMHNLKIKCVLIIQTNVIQSLQKNTYLMNEGWLYIDPKMKTSAWVDEIINTLIHTVNKIRFIAQNCVRIYKLPKELSQEQFKEYFMENCKKMNKSNNSIHYCLELKDLRLLNPEKEIMDQMDEDDTIIIDTREEQKYWTLNPLINEIEYEINSKGNSEINQNTYSKIESQFYNQKVKYQNEQEIQKKQAEELQKKQEESQKQKQKQQQQQQQQQSQQNTNGNGNQPPQFYQQESNKNIYENNNISASQQIYSNSNNIESNNHGNNNDYFNSNYNHKQSLEQPTNYYNNYNNYNNQYNSYSNYDSDDEQTIRNLTITSTSVQGQCGLNNIGNTCYLNSAVQCIVHTKELFQFFIQNIYEKQINTSNPIGSKGVIAYKFANLFKKMWCSNQQSITPKQFKLAFGNKYSQFSNYLQHDSQEFLGYLLDILHEDFNRILDKPNIESKDSNGREDREVALETWQNFKKRNDSIIIDNFYGLYKSKLSCPECQQISTTFEPFGMAGLSFPNMKEKHFQYLIQKQWSIMKKEYIFLKGQNTLVKDLIKDICDNEKVEKNMLRWYQNSDEMMELNENESLDDLYKKYKKSRLSVRLQFQEELSIDNNNEIKIIISIKDIVTYKTSISIPKMSFTLSKQMTCSDLIQFLIKITPFPQNDIPNNQQIYEYWNLTYKHNLLYNHSNPLPNNHITIAEMIKIPNITQIEIIIQWIKLPHQCYQLSDFYQSSNLQHNSYSTNSYQYKPKYSNSQFTLQQILEHSIQPEQLAHDNTWYCQNCKNHVRAIKNMQIYQPPKILIFYFKRFKKEFKKKNDALITFPIKDLDMTNYVLINSPISQIENEDNTQKQGKLIFDLYGIVNHSGTTQFGHYTAYVKGDRNWLEKNDSIVSRISENDLNSKNAYCLFYRMRE